MSEPLQDVIDYGVYKSVQDETSKYITRDVRQHLRGITLSFLPFNFTNIVTAELADILNPGEDAWFV